MVPLFDLPTLRNKSLHIYGVPDGVEPENGLLLPVEIKSHRRAKSSDYLELAFYWLLFEPLRTRNTSQRQGVLIVPGADGRERRTLLNLKENHFKRVQDLLSDIRIARRDGVEPTVCNCDVCFDRPEVAECVEQQEGVTLIWDIGHRTAKVLKKIGIRSLDDIVACDSATVVAHLKDRGHVSYISKVDNWKHHARSYLARAPVFFGVECLPSFGSFIAVDFEYDSDDPGSIYLLGAAVVREGATAIYQWWGTEPSEIGANLLRFEELLQEYSPFPIVTWSGEGAEISELRKAAETHDASRLLQNLSERHQDIFLFIKNNIRLPIPLLNLKSVSAYFGFKPIGDEISNGMRAMSYYLKYLRATEESEKQRIQAALMQYNRDDLEALIQATRCLQGLRPKD